MQRETVDREVDGGKFVGHVDVGGRLARRDLRNRQLRQMAGNPAGAAAVPFEIADGVPALQLALPDAGAVRGVQAQGGDAAAVGRQFVGAQVELAERQRRLALPVGRHAPPEVEVDALGVHGQQHAAFRQARRGADGDDAALDLRAAVVAAAHQRCLEHVAHGDAGQVAPRRRRRLALDDQRQQLGGGLVERFGQRGSDALQARFEPQFGLFLLHPDHGAPGRGARQVLEQRMAEALGERAHRQGAAGLDHDAAVGRAGDIDAHRQAQQVGAYPLRIEAVGREVQFAVDLGQRRQVAVGRQLVGDEAVAAIDPAIDDVMQGQLEVQAQLAVAGGGHVGGVVVDALAHRTGLDELEETRRGAGGAAVDGEQLRAGSELGDLGGHRTEADAENAAALPADQHARAFEQQLAVEAANLRPIRRIAQHGAAKAALDLEYPVLAVLVGEFGQVALEAQSDLVRHAADDGAPEPVARLLIHDQGHIAPDGAAGAMAQLGAQVDLARPAGACEPIAAAGFTGRVLVAEGRALQMHVDAAAIGLPAHLGVAIAESPAVDSPFNEEMALALVGGVQDSGVIVLLLARPLRP